jgi:Glutaminase
MNLIAEAVLHKNLSDYQPTGFLKLQEAEKIFTFFKQHSLFKWNDANNDCEDRANAICILLDEWNIPNCKAWVFSGYFLNKNYGSLVNSWKYHVAAAVPVKENNLTNFYIIDPSTNMFLQKSQAWATHITVHDKSYLAIKNGSSYIFPSRNIETEKWHPRNLRNFRWTMQGLAGINGVSALGRAHLAFNKKKVYKTKLAFKKLLLQKPSFL